MSVATRLRQNGSGPELVVALQVARSLEQVVAVLGVHGLPLPPKGKRLTGFGTPVEVTPTVIESTYGVAGVTVDRAGKNRQAVAEFQGQTMNR